MPIWEPGTRPPDGIRIRSARPRDAEAIRKIYNDAVRHTTATFDTEPRSSADQHAWYGGHDARHPVLVAEANGAVIGWASLSPWSDRSAYDGTAEISVYVDASWRGRRVGRSLVSNLLRVAGDVGLHSVLARVVQGNPVSRALHISSGFAPVGVMHQVGFKFGRYLDVELLELLLPARSGRRSKPSQTGEMAKP
jgi:L-amino acid N-acyltransferase